MLSCDGSQPNTLPRSGVIRFRALALMRLVGDTPTTVECKNKNVCAGDNLRRGTPPMEPVHEHNRTSQGRGDRRRRRCDRRGRRAPLRQGGYTVCLIRRSLEKAAPHVDAIVAAGGQAQAFSTDAPTRELSSPCSKPSSAMSARSRPACSTPAPTPGRARWKPPACCSSGSGNLPVSPGS